MSDSYAYQPPRDTVYPAYNTPILAWYAGYYERVFVAYHPFFRFSEATLQSVEEYPDDLTIKRFHQKVTWQEMQQRSEIPTANLLNLALLTSIGALNDKYARPDLLDQLTQACERDNIWMPSEGQFQPTMEADIVRAFHIAGHEYATFGDEFAEQAVVKHIAQYAIDDTTIYDIWLTDQLWVSNIYNANRKLLFTVDWDSFYTLICSDENTLRRIVESCGFEGFYCDQTTYHTWWSAQP